MDGFFSYYHIWITPRCSSWLRAFSSMSGSAIGRSRERQRRARLPPQGIA